MPAMWKGGRVSRRKVLPMLVLPVNDDSYKETCSSIMILAVMGRHSHLF